MRALLSRPSLDLNILHILTTKDILPHFEDDNKSSKLLWCFPPVRVLIIHALHEQDLMFASSKDSKYSTFFAGQAEANTDVHCNPLYSEAKMKEIRRSEALARVTRMLNDHMASTSGQTAQSGTPSRGVFGQRGNFLSIAPWKAFCNTKLVFVDYPWSCKLSSPSSFPIAKCL